MFGCFVDGFAQWIGGQLPAEDSGGFSVADGVLLGGVRVLIGGEHDVWGVEGEIVELRIWGEVGGRGGKAVGAGGAAAGGRRRGGDGGYPAYRAGDDASLVKLEKGQE